MNAHRPGPPHVAPRGERWVPAYADNIDLMEPEGPGWQGDHKCQQQSGSLYKTNPCNAGAVARLGGVPYCGYHLGQRGYWVDAGIGMRWELEPTGQKEEE